MPRLVSLRQTKSQRGEGRGGEHTIPSPPEELLASVGGWERKSQFSLSV